MRFRHFLPIVGLFTGCVQQKETCGYTVPTYPPSSTYLVDVYGDLKDDPLNPSEVGLTDLVATIDGDHLTFAYTDKLGRDVRVTYLISPEGEGL